jgi:hypothetical protein
MNASATLADVLAKALDTVGCVPNVTVLSLQGDVT